MTGLVSLGPCSQRELASHLRVNPTVMVAVIDALERDGLVERGRNPRDRRSYQLVLTPRGRSAWRRAGERRAASMAELTVPIGAAGDRQLRRLLRKLLGAEEPVSGRDG